MPHLTANGLSLFYEEYGEPSAKPVLLLPGLGETHKSWLEVSWRLRERWRVIAMDPRDAGMSARAAAQYAIGDMAQDAAALLGQMGIRSAHVAGFSMGGAIAQELAIGAPDLVSKLVLIATYDMGDPRGTALFRQFSRLRRTLSREEYFRTLLPWVYSQREFQESINEEDVIRQLAGDALYQEQDAYDRQAQAAVAFRSRGRLERIRRPALLVFGDEDILTPLRFARSLEAGIRGSRLAVLSGAGHGLLWTRSTEVAALVDGFLSEAS